MSAKPDITTLQRRRTEILGLSACLPLCIFGLEQRLERHPASFVMAIMGGAILPKAMGTIADMSDLSRGFIVEMVCFAFLAVYAFLWPKLSGGRRVAALGDLIAPLSISTILTPS